MWLFCKHCNICREEKNNEYTLIFFVFVKRNIISCCGNAKQTADVCTNPFPYLRPTKNPTALPGGIEPTSLVCYQVQKQALSHNTSINWGNCYCLPVRSSSNLISFDKMSKNKIACSSDEIWNFFWSHSNHDHIFKQGTFPSPLLIIRHQASMHGWHGPHKEKLTTQKKRSDKRQRELSVKVSIQLDESWSWIYHQRPSHGWNTGKPPRGLCFTRFHCVFLERTWLIIFAELFCSEISSEVFKKLLQRYENENKYGPLSDIFRCFQLWTLNSG